MFIRIRSLLFELSKPSQTITKTQQLHALITKTHLSNDPFYATRLIRFYGINGDINSARELFDEMPQRSVYLWNSIIRAYAQAHKFKEPLQLFKQMLGSEIKPDNFTFACILRACSENFDLEILRLVHGGLIVSGLGSESIVSSALVMAYSKLGLVEVASIVFEKMVDPDLVLWNSMICGYGCCGYWEKGLELFNKMRSMGKRADGYTMVGLLSNLHDSASLEIGKTIHGSCLKSGFDYNSHVSSTLVSMYLRCESLDSADQVFASLSEPDLVTWSSLITGLAQSGDSHKSLTLFKQMNMEGKKSDPILIASSLAAIAQLAIINPGIEIHGYAIRHGLDSEVMVSSALIDMYAKCSFLQLGMRVFNIMPRKNSVSYNSAILALGLHGLAHEAFQYFDEMLEKGLKPDESTFSSLLCACCHSGLVEDGRKIYGRMKDEFGISARSEHFVYFVRLIGMAGKLEEAYGFVQSLPEPVDSSVWGALLSSCDALGNSEMAHFIAEKIIENDKLEQSKYRVMISNIYAGDGKWDDVRKLRDDVNGEFRKEPGISWIGAS